MERLNIHKTSWKEGAMKLRFQERRLFTIYRKIRLAIMATINSDLCGFFSFNKFLKKSFLFPLSSGLEVSFNYTTLCIYPLIFRTRKIS